MNPYVNIFNLMIVSISDSIIVHSSAESPSAYLDSEEERPAKLIHLIPQHLRPSPLLPPDSLLVAYPSSRNGGKIPEMDRSVDLFPVRNHSETGTQSRRPPSRAMPSVELLLRPSLDRGKWFIIVSCVFALNNITSCQLLQSCCLQSKHRYFLEGGKVY